jgi:diguanylate cyclase (GGDEF)-like protein/PAS domain S-box-containing protein
MNWTSASRGNRDVCEIVMTLVDHLDAMVAYWNRDMVCEFANDAYRVWFGRTKEQMRGITLEQLLGPLYVQNLPYIRAALDGRVQVFEREIPTPSGTVRHSLATYMPHIVDGEVRGMFAHVVDVSSFKVLERQLQQARDRAEQLATHDFLTGLPNRVLLMDRINQAIGLARRKHRMVAVLSLDLDNFKQVNDTHGHGEGDRLLVEIAGRLVSGLRRSDSVTRLGGDEFVVMIPEVASAAEVEAMVTHLLQGARRPWLVEGTSMSPSFSVGIALFPRDGATAEALLASSDRALYAAKRLGKDRFAYPPEPANP